MEDQEEMGLKAIFGERFHDDTREAEQMMEARAERDGDAVYDEEPEAQTPFLRLEKPLRKAGWVIRGESAAWAMGLCALNLIIWRWSANGMMAGDIATKCMWACMIGAGWNAGKVVKRF